MTAAPRTRTALLSVSDKTGVVEFARELKKLDFNLLASRGTANHLQEAGIEARDVAEIVGDPILGHRVVTLSREIHAALLATETPEDWAELARIGMPRIDVVYVNLYPLQQELDKKDKTLASVIKTTDIGGPTLLRSAAKGRRLAICRTADLNRALRVLKSEGGPDEFDISYFAGIAEQTCASYCQSSANFLLQHGRISGED